MGQHSPHKSDQPHRKPRWHVALLSGVCAIGTVTLAATAQDQNPGVTTPDHGAIADRKAALFAQLFGDKSQTLPTSDYPLHLDGQRIGILPIQPGTTAQDWAFVDASVLDIIAPLIVESAMEHLSSALTADPTDRDALTELGITGEFSSTQLRLDLTIPLAIRQERTLSLRRYRPPSPATNQARIKPSRLSAAMNLRATGSHTTTLDAAIDTFQQDSSALLVSGDGFINVSGYVLEGRFTYDANEDDPFERDDIRLVKDDEKRALRLILGEDAAATTGFQTNAVAFGASYGREFRIRPYARFRPTGQRQIFVERPSTVTINVNGSQVRQLQLGPGRYNLEDFPIQANSLNRVDIIIEDEFGKIDRVQFGTSFDYGLLAPGVTEFNMSGGAPITYDAQGNRSYAWDSSFASAFYRRGITQTLTLGANAQIGEDQALAGLDSVWASPIGSLQITAAASANQGDKTAYVGRASYRLQFAPNTVGGYLLVTGTYVGDGFAQPQFTPGLSRTPLAADGQKAVFTTVQYSQKLPFDLRGALNATQQRFTTQPDTLAVSGSISRMFGRANVTATAQYSDLNTTAPETSARLGLNIPLGRRSTLNASHSSQNNTSRLTASRSSFGGVGSRASSAGITNSDVTNSLFANMRHEGNRHRSTVRQQFSDLDKAGDTGVISNTSATVDTALVFAGRRATMARPVNNSFAIVRAEKSLKDARLFVDPSKRFRGETPRFIAQSDWLGPAVLPELIDYIPREIGVEAQNIPVGTSLDEATIALQPQYRSGYDVVIGSDANASVVGQLTLGSAAIARQSGHLIGPDGQQSVFFTNASGRFFAENLIAGVTYEIVMLNGQTGQLTVPEGTVGLLRLDNPIQLEGAE